MLAVSAAALLALCPAALKLVKAFSVSEGSPRVLDLPVILAPDLASAALVGALVFGLGRTVGRSRAGAVAARAVTTLVMWLLLGLTALEHQTWVKTASLLDWGILSYTIRHYRELQIVIASEASVGGTVLLSSAGVLGVVPVVLDLWLGHRMWLRWPLSQQARAGWASVCVLAFGLWPLSPVMPELTPLARSASISLLGEALTGAKSAMEDEGKDTYKPSPDVVHAQIDKQLEGAGLQRDPNRPGPKNVLVFMLESTRFDATTVYAPQLSTTPQLQRLATHGAVVERAYVDMPHTSKAITSILCGYSPRWSVEINEAEVGGLPSACLPHVFDSLGYRTGFFQTALGTFENRRQFAENAGFKTFFARESLKESRFSEVNYLAIEDKAMVEPLLDFVTENKSAPFFAAVMTCGAHHSYGLPSSFKLERYPRPKGPAPTPWDDYNRYLNTVRYVDEFIGEVVRGLAQRKLLDDTLIVVVGDHGQGFMEHGAKYHNDVPYEEGLRVPLVFSNDTLFSEPKRIPGLRRQVDIAPTILSLMGVTHPDTMFDGRNLMTAAPHERVFSNCWYDDRCAAHYDGSLKVIDYFKNRPGEIYDLEQDPFEQRNLLAKATGDEKLRLQRIFDAAHARVVSEKKRVEQRYVKAAQADRSFVLEQAPVPGHLVPARFESYLELIGYDTASREVAPGSTWEAVVYFRCLKPSPEGWRLFGRFETVDNRVEQTDYNPANGRFNLQDCKEGMIIADRLRMWVPEDYPPGQLDFYWGSVLLPEKGFVRKGNDRLASREVIGLQRGQVIRDNGIRLARLEVLPKYRDDLAAVLRSNVLTKRATPKKSLEVRLGGGIVLEDAKVEPTVVRPFGVVKVTSVWRVESAVKGPWQLFTHLDTARRESSRFHGPVDGLHPVTNWQPGTWVRDIDTVVLPAWLNSGTAEVWIGFGYERRHMKITDPGNATVDTRKRIKIGTIRISK